MTDLTEKLMSYINTQGATNIKAHTKNYIRRKLEVEFRSCFNIFLGNNRLLVILDKLTFKQLARDGQLEAHWMTGSPAPQVILAFISCKCTKICQLQKCQCPSSGLTSTEECKMQTCTNMKDTDATSMDSDDEVDEDDSF